MRLYGLRWVVREGGKGDRYDGWVKGNGEFEE